MTLTMQIHFVQGKRGRRLLRYGPKPLDPAPLSRLAKLMALAIKYDEFLRRGYFRDYAHLAQVHHVDPGLISRLMHLRLLAPDVQEEVLTLSVPADSATELQLKHLLPIARIADWEGQRRVWRSQLRVRQLAKVAPATLANSYAQQ